MIPNDTPEGTEVLVVRDQYAAIDRTITESQPWQVGGSEGPWIVKLKGFGGAGFSCTRVFLVDQVKDLR